MLYLFKDMMLFLLTDTLDLNFVKLPGIWSDLIWLRVVGL